MPTPAAFVAKARELGLASVTTLVFPSMGRAPDGLGGIPIRNTAAASRTDKKSGGLVVVMMKLLSSACDSSRPR